MIIGRPRPPTPRYDRSAFWLWQAHDRDITTGTEVGALETVSGLDGAISHHGSITLHMDLRSQVVMWASHWADGPEHGGERILVLRDARGQRWVALRAFIRSWGDSLTLGVNEAVLLEEAPPFVDD